jgi:hypothetical protein
MIFKSKLRRKAERMRNNLVRELTRAKTEPELKRGRKIHHIRIKINLLNELLYDKS